MKYKNSKIFVISGLIFLILSIFPTELQSNSEVESIPLSGGVYVPEGLIALWSSTLDSIPDGWILCDGTQGTPNTVDRFILNTDGLENAGFIGGSSFHNHTYSETPIHDHGVSSEATCRHSHGYYQQVWGNFDTTNNAVRDISCLAYTGYTSYEDASHSHTATQTGTASCETNYTNILPPYYKLAFVKKIDNNPLIPAGIIMIWGGVTNEIPQNWVACNGFFNTPNLNERFLLGVSSSEDPGEIGGNFTHSHTYSQVPQHTHSVATSTANHRHFAQGYVGVDGWPLPALTVATAAYYETNYANVPHTHLMNPIGETECTTEEENHEPPYITVTYIMNTQASVGIPTGCACFWGDTIADIPIGWSQCDSSGTTADLTDKFLKGSSTFEPIGTIGGSTTHNHVYTQIPYHTHDINIDNMRHRHHAYQFTSLAQSWFLAGLQPIMGTPYSVDVTDPADAPHSHDILQTGVVNPTTNDVNNIPPHIELTIINHTSALTTINWISPDASEFVLCPRSPTFYFNFSYSWTGLGTDITLGFTNGTDNYDAGSVLGLNQIEIPYLSGEVEVTLHLYQDTTELTNATRSFIFYNNRDPSVEILLPTYGEVISGIYDIEWTGTDPDADSLVYKIEYSESDSAWIEIASGVTGSSFAWNTTTVENSEFYKIRITSSDGDGGEAIDVSDDYFTILNEYGDGDDDGDKRIPGYSTMFVILILVLLSLKFIIKRKK